jgi:tRNA pseudouridine13 synthase
MTIKKVPEDFEVEEVLRAGVEVPLGHPPGPFSLFRLPKRGLTTPEAVGQVARRLSVRPGQIGTAGLKDKHALTTQFFSVETRLLSAASGPETLTGSGWTSRRVGTCTHPLDGSVIEANLFRIRIRKLTPLASAGMDQALGRLTGSDGIVRMVNYFGDQRFGSARHGQGFLAKDLIRGDFQAAFRLAIAQEARKDRRSEKEFKRAVMARWGAWGDLASAFPRRPEGKAFGVLAKRPKDFRSAFATLPYFLQRMSLFAYQSHLWNATVRTLVLCAIPPENRWEVPSPFGPLIFPAARAWPPAWETLEVPLLGRKTLLKEPWGGAVEETLKAEGLSMKDLRVPGLRRPFFAEHPRPARIEVRGVELGEAQPEERKGAAKGNPSFSRKVAFTLPGGAYATVFLHALGQ